jgi:glycosyltransferase involved in cell wall biosynthesis
MRILIATSTFPLRDDDGLPRFVFDLAQALAEKCSVTVLAPHHPGAEAEEILGRLTVRRFQYAWPAGMQVLAYGAGMRENLRASWPARLQVPVFMAALTAAVKALSRGRRFDLINSHWLVPQALAAALACGRKRSCAHAATVHAGDLALLETLPMGRRILNYIGRRTDLFLPVSSGLAQRLQNLAGKSLPCAVQPMGVDYARFSRPPDREARPMPFGGRFILFVGRLVEKKGVALLLEAMARLAPEFTGLGLVVIGGGPLEAGLKARAGALGIGPRVQFLGRRAHKEIIAYLQACSVLAIPSMVDARGETDGMPTVLAEAMAAGCRVVAGRVEGISDWITHGRNGWLARPRDAEDLARQLRSALIASGEPIAEAARQTARRLDWPQVAASYLAHFERVLRQGGRDDDARR